MSADQYESPYDDDTGNVLDTDALDRRINPIWINWSQMSPDGEPLITSQAFQDNEAEAAGRGLPGPAMSVGLGSILKNLGHEPARMLAEVDDSWGLATLAAGDARSLNQGISPNPTPEEAWHALVFDKARRLRNKTTRAALRDRARWVRVPPNDPPPE